MLGLSKLKLRSMMSSTAVSPPAVIATLYPSATWNGTAGSGWSGNEPVKVGTAVTDTTSSFMSTNAAIAHFLEPPDFRAFVADQKIHVIADAFMTDGSNGIQEVIFDCEGRTISVTEQSVDVLNINGVDEMFWSYRLNLDHASFPSNGTARVYATVIPKNNALSTRVIGPLVYRRKTTLWDRQIRIRPGAGTDVPGVTYFGTDALKNALLFCRNNVGSSVDTIIYADGEAFTHNPSIGTGFDIDTGGNILLEGRNGGSIRVKNTLTDANINWSFRTNGMLLGAGFTLDLTNIGGLTKTSGHRMYSFLPGSAIRTDNATDLYGSTGILNGANAARTPRITAPMASGVMHSYGCYYSDMYYGPKNVSRSAFDRIDRISEDIYAMPSANSFFIFRPRVGETVSENLRTPMNAINLAYTGAGAATYSVGGPANGVRTILLKVAGTTVRTITTSTTAGTGIYQMSDLVADINTALGASGWTATLVSNMFRASLIEGLNSPSNVTVPSGGINITAWVDVHSDLGQFGNNAVYDNGIMMDYTIKTSSSEPQVDFFNVATTGRARNILYVNNQISMCDAQDNVTGTRSQFSGNQNHVLIKNVSRQNQDVLFRSSYVGDAFCGFFGCIYRGAALEGGQNITDVTFLYNEFMLANAITANGGNKQFNTTSGNASTLLSGWATGDLRSIGALLTNTTPKFTQAFIDGTARAASTYKGSAKA